MKHTRLILLCCIVCNGAMVGCNRQRRSQVSAYSIAADHEPFKFETEYENRTIEFRVDWPPRSPRRSKQITSPPLLFGELFVASGQRSGEHSMCVRIELSRPSGEEDRARWNRDLRFPEYDWMSRVRVWDHEKKWLWPNLPYLLKANGIERVQRYGGIDPGKSVDNDFAAIVVKSLDGDKSARGITASWHPPHGDQLVDKHAIVHRAVSNDLLFEFPRHQREGEFGIWLVYADFLEFLPPAEWPDESEGEGGILSYFSVTWQRTDKGVPIMDVVGLVPTAATGVDWKEWQSTQ